MQFKVIIKPLLTEEGLKAVGEIWFPADTRLGKALARAGKVEIVEDDEPAGEEIKLPTLKQKK